MNLKNITILSIITTSFNFAFLSVGVPSWGTFLFAFLVFFFSEQLGLPIRNKIEENKGE
jgi:hypothetical protein